jgi:hypothetical protein
MAQSVYDQVKNAKVTEKVTGTVGAGIQQVGASEIM